MLLCFSLFSLCVKAQTGIDEKTSKTIDSAVESEEVNELVNVVLSYTKFAAQKNYILSQNAEYNQKVRAWFDEYKDYRVIKDFDELLRKDASVYSELKTHSIAYEFKQGKLVKNVACMPDPSRLDQFIPQLEVFAISSNFHKFYEQIYKKYRGRLFPANASESRGSFQILNIMDDFWKYWELAEKADIPTRTKLFREMVIDRHKEIYEGFTGKPDDKELAGYVKGIEPYVPRMWKINEKLNKELPLALKNFKKTFPDMNWQGTAVFMPNYGSFDSGGGEINGKHYQIFGVDFFAVEKGENADLTVLFSHEFFHLYHGQFHPELKNKLREKGEVPLFMLVWLEGLATYASQRLNPDVPLEEIFLGQEITTEVIPKLPQLSKKIIDNFDNGSPDIWKPFLSATKISDDIPPRSGYYVGYRIAEELGKKMSLRKLAELKGEDLKKKMRKVLAEIEKRRP